MKKVFSFIAIAFLTAALALGALGCRDRQSLIDQAAARQNGTPPDETEQPSPTPELTDEPEIELQTSEPKGKPISFANASELWKFVDSVNLSDRDFQEYIRENSFAECGIETKDDVRAVLEANGDIDFPIVGNQSFSYMSVRKDGLEGYLEYTLDGGASCTFRLFDKSLFAAEDYDGGVPDGAETFDVELPYSPISELLGFIMEREEDHIEAYGFFGGLNGGYVEINTLGLTREQAESVISSLEFGKLNELGHQSHEGSHAGIFHLQLFGNDELTAFVRAANGTDEEFEGYLREANPDNLYGIFSRADAQRVIGILDALPFPIYTEGGYSRLFIAGDYLGEYSIQYEFGSKVWAFCNYHRDEDENGERDTLEDLVRILALSPVDIAENEHISRLYAHYSETLTDQNHILYAEVDGKLMELSAYNQTEQDCIERLLAFDFAKLSELDDLSVPSAPAEALWYYHINLPNNDALRLLVNSASLSDRDFAGYFKANKKYFMREGSSTVRSRADVEAVISLFESFPFPFHAEDGFDSLYFYVRNEEYFEVSYELPGYKFWTFFPYCGDDMRPDMSKTLDEVIAERNLQQIEIPESEYISRLYLQRSEGESIRLFYAEINGRLVTISTHNQTEREAVQRLVEFDFGPLSALGGE